MKTNKRVAALLALLFAAGSLAFSQVRPAEEFDKEEQAYIDYWMSKGLTPTQMEKYSKEHPKCAMVLLELVDWYLKCKNTKDALVLHKKLSRIIPTVPDSERGKKDKAEYYWLTFEINLFIKKDEGKAAKDAELCAQYNAKKGAEAYYTLAAYNFVNKNYAAAAPYYEKAFSYDKELSQLTANDIKGFLASCERSGRNAEAAAFFDQYMASSKTCWFHDFGALAMSAYEKAGQKGKAVLVSMLDKEYTLTYENSSADQLIEILKKNFGQDKSAASCVEFVQKFYDKSAALSQADLDSLPQNVREFLPVRYMFKMKNSSDIAELKKEFESFFEIGVGNFYIRLYEKAEKLGDQKKMAQIKEKLKGKNYNENGPNRLNK